MSEIEFFAYVSVIFSLTTMEFLIIAGPLSRAQIFLCADIFVINRFFVCLLVFVMVVNLILFCSSCLFVE